MVQALSKLSRLKDEWTFLNISTRKYTHAIHLYPARMHPEIVARVLRKYAKKSDVMFDPFMGSGGAILEAMLNGNKAIGIDINPFAVLLSKVKTTPITTNLNPYLESILEKSYKDSKNKKSYPEGVPDKYDVSNWFKPSTIKDLSILKHHVFDITNSKVSNFFKICLSLAIRKSSYQRNGSWKIHRISEEDRRVFHPKPFDFFENIVRDNIIRMKNLVDIKPTGKTYPILGDSRDLASCFKKFDNMLDDGKANIMISSPPYGDSRTTVAYGQFSRHSGHWLEMPDDKVLNVDKDGLGGRTYNDMDDLGSETLNKTLDEIHKNDIKLSDKKTPIRDKEVYSFFADLDHCMSQVSQNVVSGKSYACFVVANRTVRRIVVPTDVIITELGKKYGYTLEDARYREIPNKSMPVKNSPENVSNQAGNTMTKETIIVTKC